MKDVREHPNSPEVKTTLKSFASDCCYIKIAALQNNTAISGFPVLQNKLRISYFFRTHKKA